MTRHRAAGFTLIEALIALLVLSLGLLGVAAMQLKAMQSAQVSYQRTIATIAAQDAVERLWARLTYDTAGKRYVCPSEDEFEIAWKEDWAPYFNNFSGSDIQRAASVCRFAISVTWEDSRFLIEGESENVSSLPYVSRIPGEIDAP